MTTANATLTVSPDQHPLHHTWLTDGERPAIVLIHGFGSSISGWQPFAAQLPAGRAVLAVDLPAHGRSPITPDISFEQLVDAVEATIIAAQATAIHLVGHSLGGAISAGIAARARLDVRSLTLLSPAGLRDMINYGFMERFTGASDEDSLRQAMSELVANPALIAPPFVRSTLRQRRDPAFMPAQRAIFDRIFPNGRQPNRIGHQLETFPRPAQVIFGSKDAIIEPPDMRSLPANVDGHVLEGIGHLPFIEAADTTGRLLRQMIEHPQIACGFR